MNEQRKRPQIRENENLKIFEIHRMISNILFALAYENIRLQDKIGDNIDVLNISGDILERLQILDRHSQIIKDLGFCLARLADRSELWSAPTTETIDTLFGLDATRATLGFEQRLQDEVDIKTDEHGLF